MITKLIQSKTKKVARHFERGSLLACKSWAHNFSTVPVLSSLVHKILVDFDVYPLHSSESLWPAVSISTYLQFCPIQFLTIPCHVHEHEKKFGNSFI